jgi:hypothetical protein
VAHKVVCRAFEALLDVIKEEMDLERATTAQSRSKERQGYERALESRDKEIRSLRSWVSELQTKLDVSVD